MYAPFQYSQFTESYHQYIYNPFIDYSIICQCICVCVLLHGFPGGSGHLGVRVVAWIPRWEWSLGCACCCMDSPVGVVTWVCVLLHGFPGGSGHLGVRVVAWIPRWEWSLGCACCCMDSPVGVVTWVCVLLHGFPGGSGHLGGGKHLHVQNAHKTLTLKC